MRVLLVRGLKAESVPWEYAPRRDGQQGEIWPFGRRYGFRSNLALVGSISQQS